ncbi:molybdenum cofactor guanylyltransferase [Arthrobacter sp. USHLN218]|uniref:molybdenum cofactor guanylyltransferase n=1 Tax=Arthrobacter sp. USHLN218 TaxID=3081232 RepID=UPI00301842AE
MDRTFDAVVLAGGRSSRLSGTPKALLRLDGKTLLLRTLEAVSGARRIAVVGPGELAGELAAFRRGADAPAVVLTREDPPFAGPAAGIAAGVAALDQGTGKEYDGGGARGAGLTLILACDMPAAGRLPGQLLDAVAADPSVRLWLPVDAGGRVQPLACCADSRALREALARFTAAELQGLSVRKLIADLPAARFPLAAAATDDVDTWEDAGRFGIERPAP